SFREPVEGKPLSVFGSNPSSVTLFGERLFLLNCERKRCSLRGATFPLRLLEAALGEKLLSLIGWSRLSARGVQGRN
ncbi:unnamed protein product, partial [Ixodes pacificus]